MKRTTVHKAGVRVMPAKTHLGAPDRGKYCCAPESLQMQTNLTGCKPSLMRISISLPN